MKPFHRRVCKEQEAAAEQKYTLLLGKYEDKEEKLEELRRDLQVYLNVAKRALTVLEPLTSS